MADNTQLPGTGETYASDDIGGVKFPRVKLIHGADGANAGDVSATNPLPVAIPSGTSFVPSGVQMLTPSGVNVFSPSGLTLNTPSGFAVVATPPSGLAQPVIATYSGFFGSFALPSGALALAPSGLRTLPYGSGALITHSNPFPVSVQASGLFPVGIPSGVQIVAPSGLAVTGNLSASIGTGTFVGITASGLPVASGNPLPVVVVSGGDGSVQGVDAHDAAVTADPLTIGGYASAAAPSDVSGDADAVRAWFLRNGAQVVGLQSAGALIGAGAGVSSTALRVTIATDSVALPVTQASGTTHRVVQPSGTNYAITAASGALFTVAKPTGGIFDVIAAGPAGVGQSPSGNPQSFGLLAHGATAVASGQMVRPMSDTLGKQVVLPGAPISFRVQGVAGVQGTGSRSVIAAQGSGISVAVTSLQVVNASPSWPSRLVIHDGTSTLYAGYAAQAGGGFAPNGGQFPLFVTNPNAALQAVCLASGADIDVNISGYRVTNP